MEEPVLVECERMWLVGLSFYGDPFATSAGWTEENEIGRLWSRLGALLQHHAEALTPHMVPGRSYEVHLADQDAIAKGEFEVCVGVEVRDLDVVPLEMVVKVLPATTYAVFTLRGQEIVADWERIIESGWATAAGYRRAHPYNIQAYDERFVGLDRLDESVIEVMIPVERVD